MIAMYNFLDFYVNKFNDTIFACAGISGDVGV